MGVLSTIGRVIVRLNGIVTSRMFWGLLGASAVLHIVKGADISRIDRGDTKAVRLVFDVTQKFLAAARSVVPNLPQQQTRKK